MMSITNWFLILFWALYSFFVFLKLQGKWKLNWNKRASGTNSFVLMFGVPKLLEMKLVYFTQCNFVT